MNPPGGGLLLSDPRGVAEPQVLLANLCPLLPSRQSRYRPCQHRSRQLIFIYAALPVKRDSSDE